MSAGKYFQIPFHFTRRLNLQLHIKKQVDQILIKATFLGN